MRPCAAGHPEPVEGCAARRMAFAVAIALMLPGGPSHADAIDPAVEYSGFFGFLGALGGGVLGGSLGALSRPKTDTSADALKTWAIAGAGAGLVLGVAAGRDAVFGPRGPENSPPPTQAPSGCLGSLLGEALGLAAAAAASGGADWNDGRLYAGIALGAVVGAGLGALLPSLRFLAPPVASHRAERHEATTAEAAPREGPATPAATRLLAEQPALVSENVRTTPPSAVRMRSLQNALLAPEDLKLLRASGPVTSAPRPFVAVAPATSSELPLLVRSTTALGLAAGSALGAGLAGSAAGKDSQVSGLAGAGAAIGAFAGWYATNEIARLWAEPTEEGSADLGGHLEEGQRTGAVLAGGLVGSLSGLAAGLAAENLASDFGPSSVARSAFAGGLVGLAAGYIISTK